MKKAELIFIPLPGTSHLLPILELAKRLIDRDDRISITVLLIKLPFGGGDHGINTKSLTANSQSRIQFIDVPEADPPPTQLLMTSPETYFSVFTEKNTPHVRKIVEDFVSGSDSNDDSVRVTGLVTDIGFLGMIDVAIELALPCYIFLASNIGFLSLMSYLSTRHADDGQIGTVEFQSLLDSELVTLPGFVNPVPVSVMPSGFFNKDSYTIYVQAAHRLKNANGIIVNTFSELESYALNSFSGGGSNPPVYTVGPLLDLQVHQANLQDNSDRSQRILKWLDDQPDSSVVFNKDGYTANVKLAQRIKDVNGIIVNTFSELEQYSVNSFSGGGRNPLVYTVGPLINPKRQLNLDLDEAQGKKILNWLNDQPESSVVFLCFGTEGGFSPRQVKEIATGLEQSECRFLWSLRASPLHQSTTTTNVDDLPEGFMERARGRGMICGWAPQVDVLAHKAIVGFVSHCGWNSILESLWYGVPIVTWPLYAEQQLNAFRMVKEFGLAVEMRLDSRRCDGDDDHLVMADEIARAIRCVMDGGNEVRKKVKEMSVIARKSTLEGGSSFNSLGLFIDMNF